jgi:hypothetical protein
MLNNVDRGNFRKTLQWPRLIKLILFSISQMYMFHPIVFQEQGKELQPDGQLFGIVPPVSGRIVPDLEHAPCSLFG